MRPITTTTKIYKFEELTDSAKEQVFDTYRDINVDYDSWNDYVIENFIDDIKKEINLDLKNEHILWAVGDRNSKFGVYSDIVVKQLISRFENKGVYDIETVDKIGSFLNHLGGGICRRETTEKDLAQVYFDNEKENKAVTKEINKVINKLIEICGKYHIENEEQYTYNMSDNAIEETLLINDYEFTENGGIF